MEVVFSQTAKQALIDIYRYIAIDNHAPENAEKLIMELEQTTLSLLSHSPKIGRKFSGDNIRFIVVRKHTILYKITAKHIRIINIYPAGSNWRQ